MRRTLQIAGAVVVAAALVGGGWFAAQRFTSPEQWEAQASPPEPQPVLSEVVRGDLVDERTLSAAIVPRTQQTVALAPTSDSARSIVTESSIAPGTSIDAGAVVLRINGMPVFALVSPFPFYRDLGVGDSGPDVRALQQNLVDLGLLTRADGEFGAGTARAIERLYQRAKAEAPERPSSDPADPDAGPDQMESASGSPYLPLAAVVVLDALPAAVATLPAVGTDVSTGGQIAFASDDLVLRLSIDSSLTEAFAPGAAVDCRYSDAGLVPCRVAATSEMTPTQAGIGDGDEPLLWADVAPVDDAIDSLQRGALGAVNVTVSTLAVDALLVPAAAVAQHADGTGNVLKQQEDGTFLVTEIDIVASLNGTLAVAGALDAGDVLRVDR